jgi:mannose-6-phosphate isomerase
MSERLTTARPTFARPVLLRGDVYTSPARTPWGGTRLVEHFGKRFGNPTDGPAIVGESWELSLGPELPSLLAGSHELLRDHVARAPDAWLGAHAARSAGLLVKLLDADEPLSLQIHPPDSHPELGPDEGGKPESWYVIRHEPGAWVAFGWREGVGREDVLGALARADGTLAGLLQKVTVEVGDCFVVDAGTPHAIGPGITLVEPQFVARSKRGVTYRYWDWDRRYDPTGRPDPSGAARPLAVDEALAVTDWEHARGRALLARRWRRAGAPELDGQLALEPLAGPEARLESAWLRMERFAGEGALPWPALDALQALTVLGGRARLRDAASGEALAVAETGQTLAVPARAPAMLLEGERLHAIRSSVVTEGTSGR